LSCLLISYNYSVLSFFLFVWIETPLDSPLIKNIMKLYQQNLKDIAISQRKQLSKSDKTNLYTLINYRNTKKVADYLIIIVPGLNYYNTFSISLTRW